MAKLIGTAGHVDHGKTSLIQALTGIDADRLPEEKARGLTIDLGFAFIDLPRQGRVSIVDVPGHERFLSNMLVGALGIDLALLCVACDEGMRPQSIEHLQIIELLPVEKMVVALTRADLADADTIELVKLDVAEHLEGTRFAGSPMIEVSAKTSAGLESLKAALDAALDEGKPKRTGPWYLPIDRVFTVKGHGCVVTGTLARGPVEVGSRAFLEPGHREVRVRAIQTHDQPVQSVEPGRRVAINLSGAREEDVHRGMTLGAPGAVFETTCLDARVRWHSEPKHASRVRVSIGAAEVLGRAFPDAEDKSLVQLRLQEPVGATLGQPVIVRLHSPPDLLGGGLVEVPVSRPRRKSARKTAEDADLPTQIMDLVASMPKGIETSEICRRLGRSQQELGDAFENLIKRSAIVGFAGVWISHESWKERTVAIQQTLQSLHEKEPKVAAHARETVFKAAGLDWSGKPLDRAVATLVEDGTIEANGTLIRLPSFNVALTDRQQAFLERVILELEAHSATTPGIHELAQKLHVPMPAVEEVLKLGKLAGKIVLLDDGIAYTPKQLDRIKRSLADRFGANHFTAGEARDALQASRKYIIPLLEHLDKAGFTLRTGDKRVIR